MSLKIYHDSITTEIIDNDNPDNLKKAVQENDDIIDEISIYMISDDNAIIYRNIIIEKVGTGTPSITIEYAEDDGAGNPVTYSNPLTIPDGYYSSAKQIHRKITINDILEAFKRNNIEHKITADQNAINSAMMGRAGFEQYIRTESLNFPVYIRVRVKGTLLFRGRQFSQGINDDVL